MWTTSIALPVSNIESQDSAGFVQEDRDYQSGIPANVLDATRNDVLLANSSGYTADVIMEIEAAERQEMSTTSGGPSGRTIPTASS